MVTVTLLSAGWRRADEVRRACAGKWWAHEHIEGVRPDMVLFAKGIGSGFPVAGLAADPALLARMQPGMLGGTYGGGSMASAAAHATIDVIESEGLLQNAVERGEQLRDGLEAMRQRHAWPVRDVRGRGLMCALDFEGPASVASKVRLRASAALYRHHTCVRALRAAHGLTVACRSNMQVWAEESNAPMVPFGTSPPMDTRSTLSRNGVLALSVR